MAQINLQNFAKSGRKIIGAALNYKELLKNPNVVRPDKPVIFFKAPTSYVTEGSPIKLPEVFTRINQEVELGIVIGSQCHRVSVEEALKCVGGYCLALDLTAACDLTVARQKGLPWDLGKSFDTATPVSRFITPEELTAPENVRLYSKVSGQMQQDSNTNDLLFSIAELISFVSQYMTLEPSDLILTGTPPGASQIQAGDTVECGIGEILQMKFDVVNE